MPTYDLPENVKTAAKFLFNSSASLTPVLICIVIAGIICTGILHSRTTPKNNLYLILTETALSLSLLNNVILLILFLYDQYPGDVLFIIIIVNMIIACGVGIGALSVRPSGDDDNRRLSDWVFGLLCTMVVIQGMCLFSYVITLLHFLEIISIDDEPNRAGHRVATRL